MRHRVDEDVHEVERALSLAATLGYQRPPGDDGRLDVVRPRADDINPAGEDPYVVVHPGASVPARAPSPEWAARLVDALVEAGYRVVVTGSPGERELTARVAGRAATDLGGQTDLAGLAEVLAAADAVVVGNTGPAHLAAAVGTPVVSLFAPVVPAVRWRPWCVPHALLGDQRAQCRDTRARVCPVDGHPCLNDVPVELAVASVERLARERQAVAG